MQEEIKIYSAKKIDLLFYLTIFLLMSLFIVIGDSGNTIGWLLLIFLGVIYPVVIWSLLDNKPHLIINEKGVYYRWHYQKFFEWHTISGIYVTEMSPYICLHLKASFELSVPKGWLYKQYWGGSKAIEMGFGQVGINTESLKVDTEKLLSFMQRMLVSTPPERLLLLQKTIDLKSEPSDQ